MTDPINKNYPIKWLIPLIKTYSMLVVFTAEIRYNFETFKKSCLIHKHAIEK